MPPSLRRVGERDADDRAPWSRVSTSITPSERPNRLAHDRQAEPEAVALGAARCCRSGRRARSRSSGGIAAARVREPRARPSRRCPHARTSTIVPRRVCFAAFVARFATTWAARSRWASIHDVRAADRSRARRRAPSPASPRPRPGAASTATGSSRSGLLARLRAREREQRTASRPRRADWRSTTARKRSRSSGHVVRARAGAPRGRC